MNTLILVLCLLLVFVVCILLGLSASWLTILAFVIGGMFTIIAIHSRKNKD